MSEYRRKLAWAAGVKAKRKGLDRSSCNRQRGTIFYDDWQDGFSWAEQNK